MPEEMMTTLYNADCLQKLDELDSESIDCIVTDPPYELNFMGKGWDNAGVSFNKGTWEKCLRVLKPGGYLLAFGGTRTYHRIACAIEDAGFEIRDCIMWIYGSGFPKSMNIGLAIDKKNGVESEIVGERKQLGAKFKLTQELIDNGGFNDPNRTSFAIKKASNEWQGWGTALKPSFEPIIVARKPFKGSCVDNVLKYGVGGLNIDECRIEYKSESDKAGATPQGKVTSNKSAGATPDIERDGRVEVERPEQKGRFPANLILTYGETDFDEVCGGFPYSKSSGGEPTMPDLRDVGKKSKEAIGIDKLSFGQVSNAERKDSTYLAPKDSGSAARYFYCAKASKKDRDEGLDDFEQAITDDGRNTPIDNPYLRGETLRHNTHPTVKPTSLMQYLIRLVAPKGATILDPFMGSGSTGKAVVYENKERNAGYKFIGIEKEPEYCKIAEARTKYAEEGDKCK